VRRCGPGLLEVFIDRYFWEKDAGYGSQPAVPHAAKQLERPFVLDGTICESSLLLCLAQTNGKQGLCLPMTGNRSWPTPAFDRGRVKTQAKSGLGKIYPSEHPTLNDRDVGNGKRTPENVLTSRFYTAWAS
jgi:hypothetical protein